MGIYRRGKNWYVDLYAFGKRIRRKAGPNKKLAESVLNKLKTAVVENRYLDVKKRSQVRFEDLAKQYLDYAKANKRSWDRDQKSLKNLSTCFGDKRLCEIDPRTIEAYKTERRKTVSPATVNRELACLKHMLTKAVDWELTDVNPAKKVKLLAENNERLRYLTREELGNLLRCCPGYLEPIVITAVYTGMRKTEILKLKWEDIDLEQGIIFVRNSKNNEMRELPINDQLMGVLRKQKFRSPYVFAREDGSTPVSIRTAFENAVKKAGIKDFRFHDLRHTFASHLVMSRVDLATVKELLGHKTISMTLRYAHLSPGHKRHAVNSLRFLDSHYLVTEGSRIKSVKNVSPSKT
jgi:integrase